MLTFILAMTLHPEVQAKAQAELDSVFGGQLPSIGRQDSTPYLRAVILETLRWHPAAPAGVFRPIRLEMSATTEPYLIRRPALCDGGRYLQGVLHTGRNHDHRQYLVCPDLRLAVL